MLLLHWLSKSAQAARWKLPPGERQGSWQRAPQALGHIARGGRRERCGGEVSPASSLLWAIQEGAGWSKSCSLPCTPQVLHCGNLGQARQHKPGAECQGRLLMIEPSTLWFLNYFKDSWQGNAPKSSSCKLFFSNRAIPIYKMWFP